jgi:hypothetical protein
VALAIATQPGSGATLSCTTDPLVASSGVAAFNGCQIVGKAGSYTLSATSAGLTSATTSAFSITVGTATQLAVTTQPNGGANGATWTTQPVVTVEDSGGNTVTGSSAPVTLAIATQPGSGATFSCTTNPVVASSGVASFAGCAITGKAGSYTLSATSAGLTSATTNAFSITFGTASQLVVTTQPNGGAAGTAWTTQPVVTVEDASGNTVTSSSAPVTLAIATQPGSGATFSCTTNPVAASSGVASFAGCKITGKAGSYTLSATTSGLTGATTNPFTITFGAATQLVVTTQPNGGADGTTWTTQPVVTVEDASGNTVTGSSAPATLAIATQPGSGATLSCTTNPVAASSGVVSFAGCQIAGKAGSYTLSATSAGLTSATTSAFSITVGSAAQLAVTTQPNGGANGATWTTQPVVTVEDSGGNTVTGSSAPVTLAIATQPGSGATFSCTTNPVAASSGVASFGGCAITGKAGSYTLSATSAGLTSATSNAFSITFGTATQLAVTTQPNGGANATAWTTQPVVTVEDASGNTVTSSSASVTLAVASQPGSGATLSCTGGLSKAASSGVASFAGCQIVGTAGSYTLSAISSGLAGTTTNSFTITFGTATQMIVSTQPNGGANATAWTSQPAVTVEDSAGNTVTSSSASVALAIASQPGSGATISCTGGLSKAASSGVATFTGCQITGSIGSYTLSATASGLGSVTTSSFAITSGAAAQLAVTTQPNGGANGVTWTTQPVVTVEDSGGNTVTSSSAPVTLAIATQPGSGAVLACTTNPVTASSGVATFAGCKITGKAGSYTLGATSAGLTTATTSSFTITFGTATQLAVTTQPGGGVSGATWATQPVVTVEDASGNTVTSSSAPVTLAIATQPTSGATLTCTTNPVTASSGVASFAGCKILGTAGAYTLSATASGLTTATTSAFNITAITLVEQVIANGGAGLTTQTFNLPSASTVGDTLILLVGDDHTNNATVSSVTGGGVTTWTKVTEANGATGAGAAEVWYGQVTSSASSVTVTLSGSTNWQLANVSEWSGLAPSTPVDASTSSFGGATSFTAGPITTTQAGDLVISDAWSAATGFTTPQNSTTSGYTALSQTKAGGSYYRAWGAYQVDNATGSISAGWTAPASGNYATAIAAFKP